MATGTLIIAIIFFAARGFFLGLPGVIARLLGLIGGYFIAFSYRTDFAAVLMAKSDAQVHPLVFQLVSGTVLFFGTMLLVSLIITGLFKLLAKLIPPLRGVFSRDATGGQIAGAVVNATIGASLVIAGIWLYGLTLGKDQQPDDLQRFANRFGDTLLTGARHWIGDDAASSKISPQTSGAQPTESNRGTAEIISSDNPDKRMVIEQIREVFSNDNSAAPVDLQTLLDNKQLKELINDPAVRKKAMEYIESNPQQMMEALNNPRFRQLMEQLDGQ